MIYLQIPPAMKLIKNVTLVLSLCFAMVIHTHAQQVTASEEFDYKKHFLIHEVQWLKPIDNNSFILLQETKKAQFDLTRYDSIMQISWIKSLKFDSQWNVPQLFIGNDKLLLLCYKIEESSKSVQVLTRFIDINSGEQLSENVRTLTKYSKQGPYPKFTVSKNLEVIALYNYANEAGQMEASVYELTTGSQLKSFKVDIKLDNDDVYQQAMVENNGNLCLVYADPTFFRLSSVYFSIDQPEPVIIESGMVFTRPMEEVASIRLKHMAEGTFKIAATGKLKDDLIGVKMAEYNFPKYQIQYDTIQNFNIQYFYYLHQKDVKANPVVKKSTMKEPWRLKDYELQQMYVDKHQNTILLLEKNIRESEYYLPNNNKNLEYIYNTKRKLQRSEDIIVMAFDSDGMLYWDHVLQKHQVTRPFNFYMSFVAGLDDGYLNLLTWSKKGEASFYVNTIKTINGELVRKQVPVLPGVNHTYHKNYSAWLSKDTLLITSQKRNKKNKRSLQVVEFAPVEMQPITAEN